MWSKYSYDLDNLLAFRHWPTFFCIYIKWSWFQYSIYCFLKVCRILLNDAWGSLCIMNSCYVDYTSDIYISVKESCYFLWIIARVENYSFEYLAWTWTLLCNLVLWSVYTYLLFSLMMKVVLFLYGM